MSERALVPGSQWCLQSHGSRVDLELADPRSTVDLETARVDLAWAVSRSTVDLETSRVDFALSDSRSTVNLESIG